MQDVVRELEGKQHIYVGTPEAEYLHWQFESCGKSLRIGESLIVTFDERSLVNSRLVRGSIFRDGNPIHILAHQTLPLPREEKEEIPPGSGHWVVIEELSWYPDPKPECGDTWMTRVLTYWAHPDTKEEYATVQLVKKLTERSI